MPHRSPQALWFGPHPSAATTEFHLWAPAQREIAIEVEGRKPLRMTPDEHGRRAAALPVDAGARYAFRLDGQTRVPDPASRAQAADVGDASLIVDPGSYRWTCDSWRGRPWEETVLYELHVGLLGGFAGVAAHLERIAKLGFTAIELMPVADFPGARNWGYDGVLPFAPDRAYGTPDELKALIDRAHALGLMVFLDVVYNHFGPDGNRLAEYAPQFFRSDLKTPWGDAIDFRQPMVRLFFIENAIYWTSGFRIDGLRFDAVHAIRDPDFLAELASEVRASVSDGRHVHLVLENDDNNARLLERGFDAQWNDDHHHALHVLLTRETAGYYEDYAAAPAKALARALGEGFVYQGEPSSHRGGEPRGTPSAHLAPACFVSFLQNHDQIGNRALGERLTTLAKPDALRAAIALQLLCPQIPLVFMGEEAGAREPFFYFTDHNPQLAHAVREGRRAEFAKFPEFSDPQRREQIPDPNAPATFERSRPVFDGPHAKPWNDYYAALLQIRHREIVPRLKGARPAGAEALNDSAVLARWRLGDGATLSIAANLGHTPVRAQFPQSAPIWGTPCEVLPPASTIAWIEA
ncbi:MAG: malto-oligosyltrehalose trehalohydrolase [Rhizomicrobium sp.]